MGDPSYLFSTKIMFMVGFIICPTLPSTKILDGNSFKCGRVGGGGGGGSLSLSLRSSGVGGEIEVVFFSRANACRADVAASTVINSNRRARVRIHTRVSSYPIPALPVSRDVK